MSCRAPRSSSIESASVPGRVVGLRVAIGFAQAHVAALLQFSPFAARGELQGELLRHGHLRRATWQTPLDLHITSPGKVPKLIALAEFRGDLPAAQSDRLRLPVATGSVRALPFNRGWSEGLRVAEPLFARLRWLNEIEPQR